MRVLDSGDIDSAESGGHARDVLFGGVDSGETCGSRWTFPEGIALAEGRAACVARDLIHFHSAVKLIPMEFVKVVFQQAATTIQYSELGGI
jgi:hypothetical protein